MTTAIPQTQYAVQLVGPDKLALNTSKEVVQPGPHQILLKVEAVGLCFSDLKLLHQFNEHPRKSEVIQGLDAAALAQLPSYVPGDKPTVPGHEATCRIVAVGSEVKHHKAGERCMIQADYRELLTDKSNGAFGYNFEGALQEYVLVDERVVVDSKGERYLIPASDELGASQVALVEPWACVEDSYVTHERQTIKAGGQLAVVAEAGRKIEGLAESFTQGKPAQITYIVAEPAQTEAIEALGVPAAKACCLDSLPNEKFDDVVYFGSNKEALETLNDKLATRGIMNVVLAGQKIGAPVSVGVGRLHYGMTRWVGTLDANASESYKVIPEMGEVRDGDSVIVVGAGGPMGQMHVIRNVCLDKKNLSLVGTDFDGARLASLDEKARPFAEKNGVAMRMVNTKEEKLEETFSYHSLMAPVPALLVAAIATSKPGAIINIFAGIPAGVKHELDVDTIIEKGIFMFGTSGSTIRDMKLVLGKVEEGSLNTNASVDAVTGMAGATEGIEAVENRTMAGKIIVYPMLHEMGLIRLTEMADHYPTVAAKLAGGQWTTAAEEELLRVAAAN